MLLLSATSVKPIISFPKGKCHQRHQGVRWLGRLQCLNWNLPKRFQTDEKRHGQGIRKESYDMLGQIWCCFGIQKYCLLPNIPYFKQSLCRCVAPQKINTRTALSQIHLVRASSTAGPARLVALSLDFGWFQKDPALRKLLSNHINISSVEMKTGILRYTVIPDKWYTVYVD